MASFSALVPCQVQKFDRLADRPPEPLCCFTWHLGSKNARQIDAEAHAKMCGTDLRHPASFPNKQAFATPDFVLQTNLMLKSMRQTAFDGAETCIRELVLDWCQDLNSPCTQHEFLLGKTVIMDKPQNNWNTVLQSLCDDDVNAVTAHALQCSLCDHQRHENLFEDLFLGITGGAMHKEKESPSIK